MRLSKTSIRDSVLSRTKGYGSRRPRTSGVALYLRYVMVADKVRRFLANNRLLAVPFDKGIAFVWMRRETYCSKLRKILDDQFLSINSDDDVVLKLERLLNRETFRMHKASNRLTEVYQAFKFSQLQQATC